MEGISRFLTEGCLSSSTTSDYNLVLPVFHLVVLSLTPVFQQKASFQCVHHRSGRWSSLDPVSHPGNKEQAAVGIKLYVYRLSSSYGDLDRLEELGII